MEVDWEGVFRESGVREDHIPDGLEKLPGHAIPGNARVAQPR